MYNQPILPATGSFSIAGLAYGIFDSNVLFIAVGVALFGFTLYNLLSLVSKEKNNKLK